MRSTRRRASVLLPSPEVPVITKTGLAVEEPNQLRALTVRQAADRLRLADAALVQEAGSLDPAELRHRHEHVEDLRGRDVLGRIVEDLLDAGPARPPGLALFLSAPPH